MKTFRAFVAATILLSVTWVSQGVAGAKGGPPPPPPPPAGSVEIVFATGLDHGPVQSTVPGLHQTDAPGAVMEWQTSVTRTGAGGYHAVGGNVQGDHTIDNLTRALPLGGLEVWAGGAYRFRSFPSTSAQVWLLAAVPTDGVLGADDKPVITIGSSGRLRLSGSNSASTNFVQSQTVLARDHWYDLVLHGKNGVSQTQQLYIYDGQTDALLERLDLTLTVAGSFRNRLTKWGFGTSQDSTGLEYYLDDIFHARGAVNPGPVRVFTRTPTGTTTTGFASVGTATGNDAVDDCAPDADSTYIASAADAGSHAATFALAQVPLSAGSGVYTVQVFSVGRSAASRSLSAQVGVSIGGVDSTTPVLLGSQYEVRRTVFSANPVSGQSWTIAVANAFSGVVKDADAAADQMRFTTLWWEVVAGRPSAA